MEAWQEKRSVQNMNLRSVFTAEQQQILERYYENGMTNQSKSCFQMILQCAQETKLDFSVVRTWVGNKRRKLASKGEPNGVVAHGPAGHSLVGAGSGGLVAGMVLTPEMVAARSVQRGTAVTHLLPPVATSSSSPSPSSCSPLSGGSGHSGGVGNSNNNNDVIVTGIYSLNRNPSSRAEPALSSVSHARSATKAPPPLRAEAELPIQIHVRPVTSRTDSPPLHAKAVSLPRKTLHQGSAQGPTLYSHARKVFSTGEPAGVPRSWARQYGPLQSQPWVIPSSQTQTHSQAQPAPQAVAGAHTGHQSDSGVRIQQVFTLAAVGEGQYRPASGASGGGQTRRPMKTRSPDSPGCFSIAMETGDADDEYAREEELANMGAQVQMCSGGGGSSSGSSGVGEPSVAAGSGYGAPRRDSPGMGRNQVGVTPPNSDHFGGKGYQTPPSSSHCPPRQSSFYSGTALRGSYPLRMPFQGPGTVVPSLQQASGALSAPWITSNSRKRTLQDRTQFTDRDLHTLKRYWDNGMTSLGSVCREKISAASTELSTWIGNRRRKYRLMGIEIPPPKGGPAVFSSQSEADSPRCLSPDVDEVKTPEPGEDSERTDEVSICLSEGEGQNMLHSTTPCLCSHVVMVVVVVVVVLKIEIIDDEEEEDEDGDVAGSDMEHLQNLVEYKHEEVQYLESELENQKQKYTELHTFTRNLLNAVKNNDKEKQQELLARLPQDLEEDCETNAELEEEPSVSAITIQSGSPVPEEAEEQAPL
ncbi:hypothetical protein JZ751_018737 [Albula glossodonta]|uniref:Homeobox domain-containing protein n=1 Tax=Albula glossodonta TaxID=121402 RepID=A0A8T2NLL1_9TELE|nr:hypothetical protein JZ751_018737 [Albula glossodonta]